MTPEEFKKARNELGLSVKELARILATREDTVRKWELSPELSTSRSPNPIACQVLCWLRDGKLNL